MFDSTWRTTSIHSPAASATYLQVVASSALKNGDSERDPPNAYSNTIRLQAPGNRLFLVNRINKDIFVQVAISEDGVKYPSLHFHDLRDV